MAKETSSKILHDGGVMTKKEINATLLKAIEEYGVVKGNKPKASKVLQMTVYTSVPVGEKNILHIRDAFILLGDVVEENLDENRYVGCIKAGIGNANPAILIAALEKDKIYIAAYATEGIINQHTARKAVKKLVKKLSE